MPPAEPCEPPPRLDWLRPRSKSKLLRFSAEYKPTGMLTSPKLMASFQRAAGHCRLLIQNSEADHPAVLKVIYRGHDLSCPSRFPRRFWEEMPDRCHDASGAGIHSSTREFPHSSLRVKNALPYSQTTNGHSACHRNGGVLPGMSEFCGGMEYATGI